MNFIYNASGRHIPISLPSAMLQRYRHVSTTSIPYFLLHQLPNLRPDPFIPGPMGRYFDVTDFERVWAWFAPCVGSAASVGVFWFVGH